MKAVRGLISSVMNIRLVLFFDLMSRITGVLFASNGSVGYVGSFSSLIMSYPSREFLFFFDRYNRTVRESMNWPISIKHNARKILREEFKDDSNKKTKSPKNGNKIKQIWKSSFLFNSTSQLGHLIDVQRDIFSNSSQKNLCAHLGHFI